MFEGHTQTTAVTECSMCSPCCVCRYQGEARGVAKAGLTKCGIYESFKVILSTPRETCSVPPPVAPSVSSFPASSGQPIPDVPHSHDLRLRAVGQLCPAFWSVDGVG
jgi:hypothetical protein